MDLLKILGFCLITAILCLILKQQKSEYALLISIAGTVLIVGFILKGIFIPLKLIGEKIEGYGIKSDYFKIALKALGIGYVTSFIADSCRDCGQANLAFKAELAGKCAIFLLSVPLILSVMETALGFIR